MAAPQINSINLCLHSGANSSIEGFVPSQIAPDRSIPFWIEGKFFRVNCSLVDKSGRSISSTTESFMTRLDVYESSEDGEVSAKFEVVVPSDSSSDTDEQLTFEVVTTYLCVITTARTESHSKKQIANKLTHILNEYILEGDVYELAR
ncbi:hypothetical protein [Parashewanella tropica]|uniref:hypothetical protein n=1 Tax=Parashewanella tropica TaxID=2547970 RepID=UPI001059FB33|nr:hypothetical protein [Parashewanella tropica]